MRSIPLNYAPVGCPDSSGSRSPVASWLARSLVMSCAPSLLPACQVMLSRFLRLTPTAGSDPVFLAQTAGIEPASLRAITALIAAALPTELYLRVAALHAVGQPGRRSFLMITLANPSSQFSFMHEMQAQSIDKISWIQRDTVPHSIIRKIFLGPPFSKPCRQFFRYP